MTADPSQHFVDIDGHRMSRWDEGPEHPRGTILCVHGNPTWAEYYREVFDRFASRYRVVAPDHLGCGFSDRPEPGPDVAYTLAGHRDRLVKLVETLDLRDVTLVCHDWGGAIGMAAAAELRSRLRGIALLNTAAFPPPYIPWRIAACRTPVLGTIAIRGFNAFARAAIAMAMDRRKMPVEKARQMLAPYDSWRNRLGIDHFVRDIPMTQRHRTHQTLQAVESSLPEFANLPLALIWGMKDWCFRPECLRRFQRVWPDAEVTEIADAGHYVLIDAPEETGQAIERLLSRVA